MYLQVWSGPKKKLAALLQAPDLLLEGVRVVLVSPKTPANIGAVLRVAENFEVSCSCCVVPLPTPNID